MSLITIVDKQIKGSKKKGHVGFYVDSVLRFSVSQLRGARFQLIPTGIVNLNGIVVTSRIVAIHVRLAK